VSKLQGWTTQVQIDMAEWVISQSHFNFHFSISGYVYVYERASAQSVTSLEPFFQPRTAGVKCDSTGARQPAIRQVLAPSRTAPNLIQTRSSPLPTSGKLPCLAPITKSIVARKNLLAYIKNCEI